MNTETMTVAIQDTELADTEIVHINRKPPPGRFSLEGYFGDIRSRLASCHNIRSETLPFLSRGLLRRCLNVIHAWRKRGTINHITGDVHYTAFALRKSTTVLTIADCEILNRNHGLKRFFIKLLWFTIPVKRSARITVISHETQRQLSQELGLQIGQIDVIPVSVSSRFQPTPKEFRTEHPRILQIGTKANKNVERLADALNGLCCDVDVVGRLTREQIDAFERNGINYQTYVDLDDEQLLTMYHNCDVVSFVSTYEGFGMPIVEAQSVERICVTSNCSSMPEVAGDGAIFVDPFDVESIREGFVRAFTDAQLRVATLEQARVNRKRFCATQIASRYAEIYRSLAE